MSSKILFISDLHKRDVDFGSIKGHVNAVTQVQLDIIDYVKENNVDTVVIGGDWYDKGYRHIGPTLSDNELDRKLSKSVNGNVYLTLGNHYFLERDNNPESYIIQPCKNHPLLHTVITPDTPIFKCEDYLRVGDVQISFFHFNKLNKSYMRNTEEGVKYHIGVYHDDTVVPTNIRQSAGYFGTTTSSYLDMIYSNVDLAIINHIHVACGAKTLTLSNGRNVQMIIPGSLGITQNKDIMKHKSVKLPLLEITDEGNIRISLVEFLTHIDKLKFYAKKEKSNNIPNLLEGLSSLNEGSNIKARTLKDYLTKKGYDSKHLNLINKASSGLDTLVVYNTLFSEEE